MNLYILMICRKQQFNDVFSQENREKLGKEWVNDSHIDKLRVGGSTTSHLLDILEVYWDCII
jgi:hypothetical protein